MSDNIFVRQMGPKTEARVRDWIKALVSGKYEQANGSLREDIYKAKADQVGYGYCCLGVICQIVDPNGWGYIDAAHAFGHEIPNGWGYIDAAHAFGHEMGKEGARNGYLSESAARKYGLSEAGQKRLAKLNDNGASFAEIAVFIAENLGRKLASQA